MKDPIKTSFFGEIPYDKYVYSSQIEYDIRSINRQLDIKGIPMYVQLIPKELDRIESIKERAFYMHKITTNGFPSYCKDMKVLGLVNKAKYNSGAKYTEDEGEVFLTLMRNNDYI